ncbi:MAG: hypothetical protein HQK66_03070 [Desulfamplus sp.]|nr:hypothetical protein [Desulfamplus sp.]
MKKFKVFMVLLVVVFVALVIYQNREYFFTKQALSLNLGVETWNWTAQEVENVYYYAGCVVIGLLIAAYFALISKFRTGRKIKSLNSTITTQLKTIENLQNELDKFRSDPNLGNATVSLDKKEDNSEKNKEEDVIELPDTTAKART